MRWKWFWGWLVVRELLNRFYCTLKERQRYCGQLTTRFKRTQDKHAESLSDSKSTTKLLNATGISGWFEVERVLSERALVESGDLVVNEQGAGSLAVIE